MLETYQAHGVRFQFPASWELSERVEGAEAAITVQSPETSFWSLCLFFDGPSRQQVLETAVAALEQAYEDVDIYPSTVQVSRRESLARDLEFVCLELINSAFFRVFETDAFTALVYYQGTDHELEQTREVLEAISASLVCDQDSES